MMKKLLEGQSILQAPPRRTGPLRAPVVQLEDGLILSDDDLESPTLILGPVGSGKSVLLTRIMEPVLEYAAANHDNVVIFCAKKDFLCYRRSGDPVISVDGTTPESCWNLFRELSASPNPALTARDIARCLTHDQRSEKEPFFTNAANDVLYSSIMTMFEESNGESYTNWHLADFLSRLSVRRDAALSFYDMAELRPQHFGHLLDYFGDGIDQGYGILSEIRTLVHDAFWGSFASAEGTFSAISSLRAGRRMFLYYDYPHGSEASLKIFATILTLLLKHAMDPENGRRTWFFLDEASLLPASCLCDALSLGRQAGMRVCMCLQSARLMTRHYTENEARSILSLFPNLICLRVQDSFSRSILADRYGESLCAYHFNTPMQGSHVGRRPVVSDADFAVLQNKGDALCSFPAMANAPFFYHGYREDLS